ncbi:hypothetical protein GCM10023350_18940 [Nocardioides endophyticus]|uniref:GlsB/YeaQ/YmgE family stress response membrane protein n=1 Tax=Nocardioides endophyticus TaxID=1353775 RepID=A0ABP8YRJ8_9ACTN
MIVALVWAVIGGTVIGVLGKLVAPGDSDNVPLWLTILCGIGGCLLGDYLYRQFYNPQTLGVDWWRHGWQVVAAAVLVTAAATLTGRRRV